MHGIGNTQLFGSPGVQLYVDGVPQKCFLLFSDLYDLDSSRSSQRSTGKQIWETCTGGAINLITKKPGKFIVNRIFCSYATFNTQKYNISSSGPMDEQFSYSLGLKDLVDGY